MANYYGHARTNYFSVKDLAAFDAFCAKWDLDKVTSASYRVTRGPDGTMHKTVIGTPLVGFSAGGSDDGGFPNQPTYEWREGHTPEGEDPYADYEGPSLIDELASLLAEGWVAVGMESGAEKLCYVIGYAWAVNNRGEQRTVNIHDIYKVTGDLGEHATDCEY